VIRYDDYAEFQIQRRGIAKPLIEETLRYPDSTETKNKRTSFLKCFPNRHVMLRVVTPELDHEFVITAYFDRTRRCV
jgi:Domain of unknown function (DUF4258)